MIFNGNGTGIIFKHNQRLMYDREYCSRNQNESSKTTSGIDDSESRFSPRYEYDQNTGRYYLYRNGHISRAEWYDKLSHMNCRALVYKDGKCNYVYSDGSFLSDIWYDEFGFFRNGYVKVRSGKLWNLMDANGHLLSDKWFDSAFDYSDGCSVAKIGNNYYLVKNGKLIGNNNYDEIERFVNKFGKVKK